jgi:anti-anti-sigma factor
MAERFSLRYDSGCSRLYVWGELDLTVADQLPESLETLDGERVVVDLGGLTFIDSVGIRALLAARRNHPHLHIDNVPPSTRRVLDLIGVTDLLLDGDRVDRTTGDVGG